MSTEKTDLVYAARSSRNVLDLIVPRAAQPPPLVVFIHGGAFRMGDKTDNARERQALVDAGFAVASANYRYSDDAIWPAQLEDLRDAFSFLRSNAADFGFDRSRVASFGPSAGGHLSAACGLALAADPKARLTATVAWFPPVDFPTMDVDMEATGIERATGRNDAADSPESALIGATVAENPDLARTASPIAQLRKLPPATPLPAFLIMHGALDAYIAAEQSKKLHAAIAAFGTSPRLELDILAGGTHGGGEFENPETMTRVTTFLARSFEAARKAGVRS